MKIIKWIGNPYLFVSLYLLLLIEGDHFGGFYIVYLLLALPHGLSYSLLSVAGIALLLCGINVRRSFRLLFIITGIITMIAALFVFFSSGNKSDTFLPGFPLLTFILCGISGVCMLIISLSSIHNQKPMPNIPKT